MPSIANLPSAQSFTEDGGDVDEELFELELLHDTIAEVFVVDL